MATAALLLFASQKVFLLVYIVYNQKSHKFHRVENLGMELL